MFSTIVVGTDGSPTAAIAVDHAHRLAAEVKADLVVVTAYRPADHVLLAGLDDAEMFLDDRREHDRADPHADAESLVAHFVRAATDDGVTAEGIVRPGGAAKVLAEVAVWKRADLLVVGDRGLHGGRRFLGSVANHLSHHAPCSLLIVPTEPRPLLR